MFSLPQTRAQALASDIERLVLERGLQPGDRIATMDELREDTRLGRATISEAARLLSERGTVEVRPGRGGGLFVAATGGSLVRLRHTLLTVSTGALDVTHALAVREALEQLIDLDAARHRTDRDIADLEAILARMRINTQSRQDFLNTNWDLHRRIAAITPNDFARGVYLSAMERAVGLPGRADNDTAVDEGRYLQARIEVHAELVAAIAAGDLERTGRAVDLHHGGMTATP